MFCNPPGNPYGLTDEQRAVLEGRLSEAEAAYHTLSIGGAVASIRDQNGESITYSASSVSNLRSYINDLKMQLGQTRGVAPLQPYF